MEWQIKAKCRALSAERIEKCVWKQIKPTPLNVDDTILLGGTNDCLKTSSKEIDASLKDLKIPNKHGIYEFELACTDNQNRTNAQHVVVTISEDDNPIVDIENNFLNVSMESAFIQLHANCRALRGYIDDEWWEYVSGPEDAA